MANLPVTVTTTEPQLGEFWEKLQRGCLSNCSSIVFNPEDTQLYPRICKTHLWQVILREAIVQYELQPNTTCTLTLYQGQVSYTPMEPFIFTIDAVFRSCQPTKEEITFLRNVGLEKFITQVPWGVLHPTMVAEAIRALKEGGTTTFLKGKDIPLFPDAHWRTRLARVFQLTAKLPGEPAQSEVKDIFPMLSTLPKNQNTIRAQDCVAPGSKRPIRLLSALFCLNPTNKHNISVSFARLLQEAWQGKKVDWAAEFHAELKSETITLHQQQIKAKTKVLKSPLGPHITLILHEAGAFDEQEIREAGILGTQGLTMLQQIPTKKRHREAEEQPPPQKHSVTRVQPLKRPFPAPKQRQGAATAIQPPPSIPNVRVEPVSEATSSEPMAKQVLENKEIWTQPDTVPSLVDQICSTHKRIENLLVTLTSRAPRAFIKRMDQEFHEMQLQASQQYLQTLRGKEKIQEQDLLLENGILKSHLTRLQREHQKADETSTNYIEANFQLEQEMADMEALNSQNQQEITNLKQTKEEDEILIRALRKEIQIQAEHLQHKDQDLLALTEQLHAIKDLQTQQEKFASKTKDELRLLRLQLDTELKLKRGSNPHNIPTGESNQLIGELHRELEYIRQERDHLRTQVREFSTSPKIGDLPCEAQVLGSEDKNPPPKIVIYQHIVENMPPLPSLMHYYNAFWSLNLHLSNLHVFPLGSHKSQDEFSAAWAHADPTARDTLAFMWAKGDLKLKTGVMELIAGSPPFYIGRFVLRTLNFLTHHNFNHRDLSLDKMPILRSYPSSIYHNIKEMIAAQPRQFEQALKTLAEEDATVCYDAVNQYARLLQFHPGCVPNPFALPQLREYVTRVLGEKEGPITRRRFGTIGSQTILQVPSTHPHKISKA